MTTLDEIKQRAEAAWPGPWRINERDRVVRADVGGVIIFDRSSSDPEGWVDGRVEAEFIANARTDVPKLVAALEAILEPVDEAAEVWKDQISTHYPGCHTRHVGCLAAMVQHFATGALA